MSPKIESADGLTAARNILAARRLRATDLRAGVLALLLEAGVPLKAYAILESLSTAARKLITPASVYRTLAFLQDEGLVHRVHSLNAFTACTNAACDAQGILMIVCAACGRSDEIADPALHGAIRDGLTGKGYALCKGTIEIPGLCPGCSPAVIAGPVQPPGQSAQA